MAKTHGVFIGRFQPFHIGHQMVINEIIADGLKPLIFIGSPNITDDKNPYSAELRRSMIKAVYPNVTIVSAVENDPDNYVWAKNMIYKIGSYCSLSDAVIYYLRKQSDCEYEGKHYIDLLSDKVDVKSSLYAVADIPVCATDIRRDIEGNRHFLDGRVYNIITNHDDQTHSYRK